MINNRDANDFSKIWIIYLLFSFNSASVSNTTIYLISAPKFSLFISVSLASSITSLAVMPLNISLSEPFSSEISGNGSSKTPSPDSTTIALSLNPNFSLILHYFKLMVLPFELLRKGNLYFYMMNIYSIMMWVRDKGRSEAI